MIIASFFNVLRAVFPVHESSFNFIIVSKWVALFGVSLYAVLMWIFNGRISLFSYCRSRLVASTLWSISLFFLCPKLIGLAIMLVLIFLIILGLEAMVAIGISQKYMRLFLVFLFLGFPVFVVLNQYSIKPTLSVDNPQGVDSCGGATWYWVGDTMNFRVSNYPFLGNQLDNLELSFDASAGPANPAPLRRVALIDSLGVGQNREFEDRAKLTFIIKPIVGENIYTLVVVEPTEHVFRVQGDPRKHMIEVKNVSIIGTR